MCLSLDSGGSVCLVGGRWTIIEDNQYRAVGLSSPLSKSSFILYFILGVFAPQKLDSSIGRKP